MRYIARTLALILALLPAAVAAQQFPSVPDNTVIGRLGTGSGSGPSQAIPITTFSSLFGTGPFQLGNSGAKTSWVSSLLGGDQVFSIEASASGAFVQVCKPSPGAGKLCFLTLNGPASGANGGTFIQADYDGLFGWGIGNASSVSGGAFDATTVFLSNRNLRFVVSNTGTTPITNTLIGLWNSDSSGNVTGVVPATGISTWLATPSSANLRTALTDETGTGAAVFATSPALTTPTGIVGSDIVGNGMLVAKATAVNLNSANTDTAIAIPLPTGFTRYVILRVFVTHASTSLTTATAGVFSSTGGGGSTIVANAALSSITSTAENTANNLMSMTIALGGSNTVNFGTLQFRVGTAQGAPATADASIVYMPVP